MRSFCSCGATPASKSPDGRATRWRALSRRITARGSWPRACCRKNVCAGCNRAGLDERHVVVFADALQYQKSGGALAAVNDEMRTTRRYGVRLAPIKPHFFRGLAHEYANRAVEHVKRVTDMAVKM